MKKFTVLAVGRDALLLETRNLVLRAAGYEVVSELSVTGALKQIASRRFDVALLCHSLLSEERRYLANFVHETQEKTVVVSIAPREFISVADEAADAVVYAKPEKLLKELDSLVQRNASTALE